MNPHKWLGVPMDCSVLWTRRQEEFRNAFSLVPEFLRSPDDALNLSEVSIPARTPLPCAQALGRAPLLRAARPPGAPPRAPSPGRALRGLGAGRARLGGDRAEALLARLLPLRGARTRTTSGSSRASTTRARCFSRTRASPTATSCAWRSATSGRPRRTSGSRGTCSGARQRRSEVEPQRPEHAAAVRGRREAAASIQTILRAQCRASPLDLRRGRARCVRGPRPRS